MNVPARYDEDIEAAQRIARWLEHYRAQRGWTRMRLAKELGVERATIGKVLAGERGVGLGLAVRICRRLLIDPHDLLLREPRKD